MKNDCEGRNCDMRVYTEMIIHFIAWCNVPPILKIYSIKEDELSLFFLLLFLLLLRVDGVSLNLSKTCELVTMCCSLVQWWVEQIYCFAWKKYTKSEKGLPFWSWRLYWRVQLYFRRFNVMLGRITRSYCSSRLHEPVFHAVYTAGGITLAMLLSGQLLVHGWHWQRN
jgi:hypothetical protein